MLELGYPGGPAIERAAKDGDSARFALPRPMKGRPGCHFSFSGLKTAVKHTVKALPAGGISAEDVADVCASFQAAAGEALIDRTRNALVEFRNQYQHARTLVVAGGVAANAYLRGQLADLAETEQIRLAAPPQNLCTDNGAMIAWAGIERLKLGLVDPLDFRPRPRWPLDPDAPPAAFAGVKA